MTEREKYREEERRRIANGRQMLRWLDAHGGDCDHDRSLVSDDLREWEIWIHGIKFKFWKDTGKWRENNGPIKQGGFFKRLDELTGV